MTVCVSVCVWSQPICYLFDTWTETKYRIVRILSLYNLLFFFIYRYASNCKNAEAVMTHRHLLRSPFYYVSKLFCTLKLF